MKKQLLLLLALFTFSLASAQIPYNPPFDLSACDTGNVAPFYFTDQTATVLGNLSPNDYTVTYHLSLADAMAGTNPLPEPFLTEISQVIYIRISENANPANYEVTNFNLTLNPLPTVPDFGYDVCDMDGIDDGISYVDLGSLAEHIWGWQQMDSVIFSTAFFQTQTDADNNSNPLVWGNFMNMIPFTQVIYVRITNNETGCSSTAAITLYIDTCGNGCPTPTQLTTTNITLTSATFSWTGNGAENQWQIYVVPTGSPAPGETVSESIITSSNPFGYGGLTCGFAYDYYVRAICSSDVRSAWSAPVTFVTGSCFGMQPIDLVQCGESGMACFDLTVNEQYINEGSNETYDISYFLSAVDAETEIGAIASPENFCTMSNPTIIYARVEIAGTQEYTIVSFMLTVQEIINGSVQLTPLSQCDADDNGWVTFDLTAAGTQLETANALAYYTTYFDAINGTNPITTETAYVVPAQTFTSIFIREDAPETCDIIHTVQLSASSNCDIATICASANSLCNALGTPFNNSQNIDAEIGNDYSCLSSQPNPTWFFIPVSTAGNINLTIEQNGSAGFNGNPLDVDFICYGPFANPVTPCSGMLNANTVVDCSYSPDAIENVFIPNTQVGQYYLLMVTNYSNQPGFIRINENGGSTGEIDCSGLRLNAFLDANANGTKDSGEQDFPLGQFTYERNNDSNVHNITSPTGIYTIYEGNPSNSYDIGYVIDPAYTANYALTTASYSNINVVAGGGMQEYFFPVTVAQSYNDLSITIIPSGQPNPGFSYQNIISYSNLGSQTVASGTVTFVKDPLVTIIGNTESGAVSNANGFTYNFANLLPFETRDITVTMQVPTIPTVSLNQLLTNSADIVPLTGDVAPENNSSVSAQIVIGSYDPNDKMESRGEQILISNFTNDDYLYYTVRFENTGTANAQNIRITDILDSALDETSVKMVNASHNCILDRVDNSLTWRFENIQLPPTSINIDGGKGFVHFKVKPRPGFAVGDIIPNTASIYFDFNPAIVTNEFLTRFVAILGTDQFSGSGFMMYPNPAGDHVTVSVNAASAQISGIAIYDMLGKTILSQKTQGNTSETIDVSGISSGIYLLEVSTASGKEVKKLTIR